MRLLRALAKKTEFEYPFHALARINLRWVIDSFWRRKAGNKTDAVDPTLMPDVRLAEDDTQSLDMQRLEFVPWLDGLSDRDRSLLCQRIFFDLSPEQVAQRLVMKANAVNVALFRALERARRNNGPPDVSDSIQARLSRYGAF